jgi:N-acetylneuraminic acid mutarotase
MRRALLASSLLATAAAQWSPLTITGGKPRASMAHVAGLFNQTAVVFGGCTSSCCFAPISDMWQLTLSEDGKTGQWTSLTLLTMPSARFYAAGAVLGDSLFMFGGQDSSQAFLDELWEYSFSDRTWTELRPFGRGPSARATHSMTVIGDHLVVYGGYSQKGVLGDVWALDPSSGPLAWKSVMVKEEGPSRSNHAAAPVAGKTALFVFGGSDPEGQDQSLTFELSLDLEAYTGEWSQVAQAGQQPPIRHGAVAMFPASGSATFGVFGGLNTTSDTLPTSFLDDSYVFSAEGLSWEPLKIDADSISARAYAAVARNEKLTFVYGGFAGYTGDTDDRLLGDAWTFLNEGL